MIPIREHDGGLTFEVKVHPRAKRDAITGEIGTALKLSLRAPAIEGRANQACIEFFAKVLSVPGSAITILRGERSRLKTIRIQGITADELRQGLNQN